MICILEGTNVQSDLRHPDKSVPQVQLLGLANQGQYGATLSRRESSHPP